MKKKIYSLQISTYDDGRTRARQDREWEKFEFEKETRERENERICIADGPKRQFRLVKHLHVQLNNAVWSMNWYVEKDWSENNAAVKLEKSSRETIESIQFDFFINKIDLLSAQSRQLFFSYFQFSFKRLTRINKKKCSVF